MPEILDQIEDKARGIKKSAQEVTKAVDKVEEITRVDVRPAEKTQVVPQKPSFSVAS